MAKPKKLLVDETLDLFFDNDDDGNEDISIESVISVNQRIAILYQMHCDL